MKNRYYIMRHGESEANVARLIVSDPKIGITRYGLTANGLEQVANSVKASNLEEKITMIYSSDFIRAKETAHIAASICRIETIYYTPLLRERFFGNHDGKDDSLYEAVWKEDSGNPDNRKDEVESPNQVKERVITLIKECEQKHKGETILLVSHGDALQILLAALSGIEPHKHRTIPHLDKSEVRELEIHNTSKAKERLC